MNTVVFLTGGTGFLGTWIARYLIENTDCQLLVLVRADAAEAATPRLARAWSSWPALVQAIGGRVEVLVGDTAQLQLGFSDEAYLNLARRITHIIHAAADIRLHGPIDELRASNVNGTSNLLTLAKVARRYRLQRFSHVSTAYIAGSRVGEVAEHDLASSHGFVNSYEQSKYEAECLVAAAKVELPVSVFRPGMIVGDSETGAVKTFNTIYTPLRLYLTGKLPVVPAEPSLRVNLVPVDWVASAVARLTFEPQAEGLTFHLTAPSESQPRADELVSLSRAWADKNLNVHLRRPIFAPALIRSAQGMETLQDRLGIRHGRTLDAILSLAPYFGERRHFRRDNTDRLLGRYDIDWRQLVPKLLEYATYAGFLHRSDRTVHEQVFHRLQSRSRPVTYHDLVEGRNLTRSAGEVRADMIAAAAALRALGVQPRDRVALVGLNSTRYLTLDVAIGLVGAVSVPLYYTSPPADLNEIIQASGARLLFVGAPRILSRAAELKPEVPIVSFCRESVPSIPGRAFLRWDDFLGLAPGSEGQVAAPVGFEDAATLRYTSGTTGQPKGAVFSHSNLRYMAESLASLLPWQARNTEARHLSFLPMNHVVEGILATYSPYYLPAPLHIYFLEQFHDLQWALPRVRPTAFFSVPRFYAKVWESFSRTPLGRWYLRHPQSLWRQLARPAVRWLIVRQAGLDRCMQLIAGSAPSGEDLLQSFRQLGIEIHDAYGLTEAPLVTLNRLGSNRLGTVGEPLPHTEVRVAEDGEVLVRGPQVMTGYCDQNEQPFRNGWLLTGDLGHVSPEGSLILQGRKKDIVVTAYGKNIFPLKIESLLRDVPGVTEAILIGERRPYCTALLWLQNEFAKRRPWETVDRAIREMNCRLSHPEQIKRWAILANDLSPEGGDLTANLKLKRSVVTRRCAAVIDSLYNGELLQNVARPPVGVLHVGVSEGEGAA